MVKIKLCAIDKNDLDLILSWRNSENVMPFCRQYRPLSLDDMELWYDSLKTDSSYNLPADMFLIKKEHKPIGVGGFVRIDHRNRIGELSFYIGEDTERSEENIANALSELMEYAFQTLGLHKVYFPCYSFNPYLELYEKVMLREYIAKQEYYWQGKFWDRIILTKYAESK